eukprot:CAMPEP_0198560406 /NCGR_PEP_ID=MMETSP1462-20131121/93908_1 /TAXON_ID=1333877 /ORGANISM="Brandtodinium nutriculum, Strain RCC3387" /LENGTH=128 /DNA_ID=CAMNT_0044291271 /DNA_START=24 /DNA_END=407 /DNA_ORIENTATION=+
MLIAARADVNIQSGQGETQLNSRDRGIQSQRVVDLANMLMSATDANNQSGAMDPQEARQGETPLHVAAAMGRHELAAVLLQASPDVNLVTRSGLTAMDNAKGNGCGWQPGWRSECGARKVVELLQAFQ